MELDPIVDCYTDSEIEQYHHDVSSLILFLHIIFFWTKTQMTQALSSM